MIPDVSEALWDWTDAIELRLLQKGTTDYQASKTLLDLPSFQGHLQPTPPTKLWVKPEGQRTWQWWMLYTTEDLPGGSELVTRDGKQFKVMSKTAWPNVKMYELVQMPIPKT
jgi:hypothetical protein